MSQILQHIKKRPRAAMERGMHRRPEEAKSIPVLTATTRQSGPRLAKWAIELSENDITYQPRTAIKSGARRFCPDFSAEILPAAEQEALRASDGILPQDKKEAKKLRVQAARYSLVNHDLYKRTFGGPLAKCLGPHQTRQVLEEVHEGHCGAHIGNRALVRCLIRAGYYWPTMKKEAADYVRRCEQCQKYAPMIHQAGELLHSVTSPWPFIK
ncbi:PREDICTED: uncharacterized protein LOC109232649 [Nicotiana attenuata]|uniref:uncharacterized protein LOC109232649 n=1 Tax=Nicotiana attenuata TaxID=49451 RepID=UPI0009057676|nr:PREDICTED: uncharacterized protein LOC109232649 [Nicotiana attenuata]